MKPPDLSQKEIAAMLIDAEIHGEATAAEMYKMSSIFINEYRRRMASGEYPEAQEIYKDRLSERSTDWTIQAHIATSRGLEWAIECFRSLDTTDPEAVKAGAALAKAVADIALTKSTIDERRKTAMKAQKEAEKAKLKMVK